MKVNLQLKLSVYALVGAYISFYAGNVGYNPGFFGGCTVCVTFSSLSSVGWMVLHNKLINDRSWTKAHLGDCQRIFRVNSARRSKPSTSQEETYRKTQTGRSTYHNASTGSLD